MDKAPELFTMEQVAARMHKSRRWLQDYLRDHPYYRLAGRTKLFTEQDVARLIEDLPKCPSISNRRGQRPGTQTGRSAENISERRYDDLLELLTKKSPRQSSKRSQ